MSQDTDLFSLYEEKGTGAVEACVARLLKELLIFENEEERKQVDAVLANATVFSDFLVDFAENEVLQQEHRYQVLAIVMREVNSALTRLLEPSITLVTSTSIGSNNITNGNGSENGSTMNMTNGAKKGSAKKKATANANADTPSTSSSSSSSSAAAISMQPQMSLADLFSLITWITRHKNLVECIYCPYQSANNSGSGSSSSISSSTSLSSLPYSSSSSSTATAAASLVSVTVTKEPSQCDLFDLLPHLCHCYMHGSFTGNVKGAALHLTEHCGRCWQGLLKAPSEALLRHSHGPSQGSFYTQLPTDIWQAFNQHLSLAFETDSTLLQYTVASSLLESLNGHLQFVSDFVDMDLEGGRARGWSVSSDSSLSSSPHTHIHTHTQTHTQTLLQEIELEFVCALCNDVCLHMEECKLMEQTFTSEGMKKLIHGAVSVFRSNLHACAGSHMRRLIRFVLSDVEALFAKVFTHEWLRGKGRVVEVIISTLDDYLHDFESFLLPDMFKRLTSMLFRSVAVVYTRSAMFIEIQGRSSTTKGLSLSPSSPSSSAASSSSSSSSSSTPIGSALAVKAASFFKFSSSSPSSSSSSSSSTTTTTTTTTTASPTAAAAAAAATTIGAADLSSGIAASTSSSASTANGESTSTSPASSNKKTSKEGVEEAKGEETADAVAAMDQNVEEEEDEDEQDESFDFAENGPEIFGRLARDINTFNAFFSKYLGKEEALDCVSIISEFSSMIILDEKDLVARAVKRMSELPYATKAFYIITSTCLAFQSGPTSNDSPALAKLRKKASEVLATLSSTSVSSNSQITFGDMKPLGHMAIELIFASHNAASPASSVMLTKAVAKEKATLPWNCQGLDTLTQAQLVKTYDLQPIPKGKIVETLEILKEEEERKRSLFVYGAVEQQQRALELSTKNINLAGTMEKKSRARGVWQSRYMKLSARQNISTSSEEDSKAASSRLQGEEAPSSFLIYTLFWYKEKGSPVLKSINIGADLASIQITENASTLLFLPTSNALICISSAKKRELAIGVEIPSSTSSLSSSKPSTCYSLKLTFKAIGTERPQALELRYSNEEQFVTWMNGFATAGALSYDERAGAWNKYAFDLLSACAEAKSQKFVEKNDEQEASSLIALAKAERLKKTNGSRKIGGDGVFEAPKPRKPVPIVTVDNPVLARKLAAAAAAAAAPESAGEGGGMGGSVKGTNVGKSIADGGTVPAVAVVVGVGMVSGSPLVSSLKRNSVVRTASSLASPGSTPSGPLGEDSPRTAHRKKSVTFEMPLSAKKMDVEAKGAIAPFNVSSSSSSGSMAQKEGRDDDDEDSYSSCIFACLPKWCFEG